MAGKREKQDETYTAYVIPFKRDSQEKTIVIHSPITLKKFIDGRTKREHYEVSGKRHKWFNWLKAGCNYSNEVDFQDALDQAFDGKPYEWVVPILEKLCKRKSLTFKLVLEN